MEDSKPITYVRLHSEDSNDNDPEVAAASTTKPITSGLRSTITHLRARGAIWSCFRGPRIAPAAALYNLMCATFSLPPVAAKLAGWTVTSLVGSSNSGYKGLLGFLVIGILPALFLLLLSIPAWGIFTRVAASMLPEEDDPIVPFDRLFGGKVKPGVVLGLRDAWTTFDWPLIAHLENALLQTDVKSWDRILANDPIFRQAEDLRAQYRLEANCFKNLLSTSDRLPRNASCIDAESVQQPYQRLRRDVYTGRRAIMASKFV